MQTRRIYEYRALSLLACVRSVLALSRTVMCDNARMNLESATFGCSALVRAPTICSIHQGRKETNQQNPDHDTQQRKVKNNTSKMSS